jgi:hypothetical protein
MLTNLSITFYSFGILEDLLLHAWNRKNILSKNTTISLKINRPSFSQYRSTTTKINGKNAIITDQIKDLYKKTRTSVDNKQSYSEKKTQERKKTHIQFCPDSKLQFSFDGNPLRGCLSLHMQHKNHGSTQIFYFIK